MNEELEMLHEQAAQEAEDMMMEQEYEEMVPGPESDEEVFPGGPTWAQVEEWRRQYGDIYSVELAGETYIFRLLRRIEYKDIMRQRQQDAFWREEKTVELCVLWPPNFRGAAISGGKAGVPTLLAEQIMDKSGFALDGEAVPLDPKNF